MFSAQNKENNFSNIIFKIDHIWTISNFQPTYLKNKSKQDHSVNNVQVNKDL